VRKSNLERRRDARRGAGPQVALSSVDDLLTLMLGGPPNPTQRAFIFDNSFSRAYKGPAGCAKTSTLCAAGLLRALLIPNSRGFVSRADYNDLMDTTLQRMQEMLERLPKGLLLDRDKSPPMKWWIEPIGIPGDEDREPSQITFMGLKDALGSIEADWWIVDEADEVDKRRWDEIHSRMRGPTKGNYMVAAAFNPPDKQHWLYEECTGLNFQNKKTGRPVTIKLFEPRPDENVRNLPDGYYQRLTEKLPEDMRMRLVQGEWGVTHPGQPVYREFRREWHVRRRLKWEEGMELIRFWDFGYRYPYCGFSTFDAEGRWLILDEYVKNDIEAEPFARDVQRYTATNFPRPSRVIDFGDPAARQKKDTGSTLVAIGKAGVRLRYQISTIKEGLRICRGKLTETINGEPAVQFAAEAVPVLIGALSGGYHTDDRGDPVKDGYYDHPADGWRYGAVNLFSGQAYTSGYSLPDSLASG